MITAVYLAVTVEATLPQGAGRCIGGIAPECQLARVIDCLVALLTQEGWPCFQHARDDRAVRFVTVCAVLGHRLMFKQHGALLFRMAAGTGVGLDYTPGHRIQAGTVGLVAVYTAHQALQNRMAGWQVQRRSDRLVAAKAGFNTARVYRVPVYGMAAGTADIGSIVSAASPIVMIGTLMARQARLILRVRGISGQDPVGFVPDWTLQVCLTGAVTAGTALGEVAVKKLVRLLVAVATKAGSFRECEAGQAKYHDKTQAGHSY